MYGLSTFTCRVAFDLGAGCVHQAVVCLVVLCVGWHHTLPLAGASGLVFKQPHPDTHLRCCAAPGRSAASVIVAALANGVCAVFVCLCGCREPCAAAK